MYLILLMKLVIKKINHFEESVKKTNNDKNYKLTDFLLERHFMFKAADEINE